MAVSGNKLFFGGGGGVVFKIGLVSLCISGCPGTCFVGQAGFKLKRSACLCLPSLLSPTPELYCGRREKRGLHTGTKGGKRREGPASVPPYLAIKQGFTASLAGPELNLQLSFCLMPHSNGVPPSPFLEARFLCSPDCHGTQRSTCF